MPELPVVEVVAERETRISRLVEQYGAIRTADLEAAVHRLDQRLDRVRVDAALNAIRAGRVRDAIEIVLDYYDSAYNHRLTRHERRKLATYRSPGDEPGDLVRLINEGRGILDA